MDIVSRVIVAIDDFRRRGLEPDVLVLGTNEAEELRVICETVLEYECKDIAGWEHQDLKVAKVDIENYMGIAAAQEDIEESQVQQPTAKVKTPATPTQEEIHTCINFSGGYMKLSFEYLKNEILKCDAKSVYQQASIVILRSIFKEAEEIFTSTNSAMVPCNKIVAVLDCNQSSETKLDMISVLVAQHQ